MELSESPVRVGRIPAPEHVRIGVQLVYLSMRRREDIVRVIEADASEQDVGVERERVRSNNLCRSPGSVTDGNVFAKIVR